MFLQELGEVTERIVTQNRVISHSPQPPYLRNRKKRASGAHRRVEELMAQSMMSDGSQKSEFGKCTLKLELPNRGVRSRTPAHPVHTWCYRVHTKHSRFSRCCHLFSAMWFRSGRRTLGHGIHAVTELGFEVPVFFSSCNHFAFCFMRPHPCFRRAW